MGGTGDRLDRRALGRATLERQLLLGRRNLEAAAAVARLAGLNAQDTEPPYLSLWSRLAGFGRDDLGPRDRRVVRAALLRATQHLATADDYLAWRPLLQPVLARTRQTFARATGAGVDLAELAAAARTWSGLTRLREPVERLAPELRRFRDDHGRALYDLPDAPAPTPAPRPRSGSCLPSTTSCWPTPTAPAS